MKRLILLLLVFSLCLPFAACSKKEETEEPPEKIPPVDNGIDDILFLGDDLMETSKVYKYFEELCALNGREVSVNYMTLEDARMYTYAEMCREDGEFRTLVGTADILLFQEGSAETVTTVESVTEILSYANDPAVVCISYYGYPRWMHRNLFLKIRPDFKYADSNTVIGSIIGLEYPPLGYEHLYREDYIHPNELNGFIVSLLCYAKTFNVKPADIVWEGMEEDEALLVDGLCENPEELEKLLINLQRKTDKYMN